MTHIYLDYAATTPVDPEVLRAMEPYFSLKFGNPGSLHSFGQAAIAAVDMSRETIAKAIGSDFREVIFFSSATEANNFVLRSSFGVAGAHAAAKIGHPKIIISGIEHESILETARDLARQGAEVVSLPVSKEGVIDIQKLKEALDERTIAVSIMYANNEIGTIEPIAEVRALIDEFGAKSGSRPIFHIDAVQAFQFLACDVRSLGVDCMTFSSHKLYGPKGAAALYIKASRQKEMSPLVAGGGQEFGLRSGTENVPAIVGFAKATQFICAARESERARIASLGDYFWMVIKKIDPLVELNGPLESLNRLPNILNIYFPGHTAEDMLTNLDIHGIAASAGSACRARAIQSSYVIEALGYPEERAKASIRFSFGRPTTKDELDLALAALQEVLA